MTGDLTDSGERSEFLRFRALMDSAGLPYLPFIGNHDVWPYVSASDEAAYAWGDSLAAVFFADVYQSFSQRVLAWESASLLYSVPNPETGFRSRFHHFTFVYGGVRFVGVEGVSRQPAPLGQAGVGPQADLHDFPGGTFRFLDTLLGTFQPFPLVFLCHYPLINSPTSGINTFSPQEYDRIVGLLYPHRDKVRVWVAGIFTGRRTIRSLTGLREKPLPGVSKHLPIKTPRRDSSGFSGCGETLRRFQLWKWGPMGSRSR